MDELRLENPYVGPRPYERGDTPRFFGREGETQELLSLVVAHRVVLLYAASGAGKTSLLSAGLLPLLEQDHFEVLPIARIQGPISKGSLSPEAGNVYALSVISNWHRHLLEESGEITEREPQMTLAGFLAERPHAIDPDGLPAPRAIVFDQFEELFTLHPEHWRQREAFVGQIAEALDHDPLLRVVFAVREDYLARLDPYASQLPEGLRYRFRLERLTAAPALRAVTKPLQGTGRSFAPNVAEQLVGDLMTFVIDSGYGENIKIQGEFAEPVQLQVVCQRLWDQLPRDVREISQDDLVVFGDFDEVLGRFYVDSLRAVARRTGIDEEPLRRWIEQTFVTPGRTRGTVYRATESTAGMPNSVLDELENRYLIRAEWRAGARWYELTHDRLIDPILESNAAFLTARAAAVRRRLRRRLGVVGALAALALVAIALNSLFTGGGSESTRAAEIRSANIAFNVRFRAYVVSTNASTGGISPSQLRRQGNTLAIAVGMQGFKNETLTLTVQTVPRNMPKLEIKDTNISIVPERDVDSASIPVWLPVPTVSARYFYRINLTRELDPLLLAQFETQTFTVGGGGKVVTVGLNVALMGTGRGTVRSVPAGIACPPACSASFPYGTSVQLTASAARDSRFVGWTGGCKQTGASCIIRSGPVTAVRALFTSQSVG